MCSEDSASVAGKVVGRHGEVNFTREYIMVDIILSLFTRRVGMEYHGSQYRLTVDVSAGVWSAVRTRHMTCSHGGTTCAWFHVATSEAKSSATIPIPLQRNEFKSVT